MQLHRVRRRRVLKSGIGVVDVCKETAGPAKQRESPEDVAIQTSTVSNSRQHTRSADLRKELYPNPGLVESSFAVR